MRLLVLLDFDGVLFNSAYEVFKVCEIVTKKFEHYFFQDISFEEFLEFRAYLTDAWQFNRLYNRHSKLLDFSSLVGLEPNEEDWQFAKDFFAAREQLMLDPDWAKLMSPYDFFYQIQDVLKQNPGIFRILSTRNSASIIRILEYFSICNIDVFGQEQVRACGSKLNVAIQQKWFATDLYTVYVDDMHSHLEPFEHYADVCFHAGWGYDLKNSESITASQLVKIIKSLVCMEIGKK